MSTTTSTQAARTIIAAATSCAAGATVTGNVANLTTAFGGLLTAKITNGGTGPTVAASVYLYTSHDNVNFKLFGQLQANATANAINEFAEVIPPMMYFRADVKDNTIQAVTCEAFLQELSSYSTV